VVVGVFVCVVGSCKRHCTVVQPHIPGTFGCVGVGVHCGSVYVYVYVCVVGPC